MSLSEQLSLRSQRSDGRLGFSVGPGGFRPTHRAASLLYPDKAVNISRDTIYNVGVNGFYQLCRIDGSFKEYEELLFSESAKERARHMISEEENSGLDDGIDSMLLRLCPFLLSPCAQKAVEWLLRRFDIHIHNEDAFVACFLPYHETSLFPQAARLVAQAHRERRLSRKGNISRSFDWVRSCQSAPIKRGVLVHLCTREADMLRFVCVLARKTASSGGRRIGMVMGFYSALVLELLARTSPCTNETLQLLLPFLLGGLRSASLEYRLASLMIVGGLSAGTTLAERTVIALAIACATAASGGPQQAAGARGAAMEVVLTLAFLCQSQPTLAKLPEGALVGLLRLPGLDSLLREATGRYDCSRLIHLMLHGLMDACGLPTNEKASRSAAKNFNDVDGAADVSEVLVRMLETLPVSAHARGMVARLLGAGEEPEGLSARVMRALDTRYPAAVDAGVNDALKSAKTDKHRALISKASMLAFGGAHKPVEGHCTLLLGLAHPEAAVRVQSIDAVAAGLPAVLHGSLGDALIGELSNRLGVWEEEIVQERVLALGPALVDALPARVLLDRLESLCLQRVNRPRRASGSGKKRRKKTREEAQRQRVPHKALNLLTGAYLEAHPEDSDRVVPIVLQALLHGHTAYKGLASRVLSGAAGPGSGLAALLEEESSVSRDEEMDIDGDDEDHLADVHAIIMRMASNVARKPKALAPLVLQLGQTNRRRDGDKSVQDADVVKDDPSSPPPQQHGGALAVLVLTLAVVKLCRKCIKASRKASKETKKLSWLAQVLLTRGGALLKTQRALDPTMVQRVCQRILGAPEDAKGSQGPSQLLRACVREGTATDEAHVALLGLAGVARALQVLLARANPKSPRLRASGLCKDTSEAALARELLHMLLDKPWSSSEETERIGSATNGGGSDAGPSTSPSNSATKWAGEGVLAGACLRRVCSEPVEYLCTTWLSPDPARNGPPRVREAHALQLACALVEHAAAKDKSTWNTLSHCIPLLLPALHHGTRSARAAALRLFRAHVQHQGSGDVGDEAPSSPFTWLARLLVKHEADLVAHGDHICHVLERAFSTAATAAANAEGGPTQSKKAKVPPTTEGAGKASSKGAMGDGRRAGSRAKVSNGKHSSSSNGKGSMLDDGVSLSVEAQTALRAILWACGDSKDAAPVKHKLCSHGRFLVLSSCWGVQNRLLTLASLRLANGLLRVHTSGTVPPVAHRAGDVLTLRTLLMRIPRDPYALELASSSAKGARQVIKPLVGALGCSAALRVRVGTRAVRAGGLHAPVVEGSLRRAVLRGLRACTGSHTRGSGLMGRLPLEQGRVPLVKALCRVMCAPEFSSKQAARAILHAMELEGALLAPLLSGPISRVALGPVNVALELLLSRLEDVRRPQVLVEPAAKLLGSLVRQEPIGDVEMGDENSDSDSEMDEEDDDDEDDDDDGKIREDDTRSLEYTQQLLLRTLSGLCRARGRGVTGSIGLTPSQERRHRKKKNRLAAQSGAAPLPPPRPISSRDDGIACRKAVQKAVGVDLIIRCIRGTHNPQVHNDALLLLSGVCRLDHQACLESLQPLLAFIGGTTLRQDDTYTYLVVHKTLAALLAPVVQREETELVASVLSTIAQHLAHLPRHRRLPFFAMLVRTLGRQYLHIVLLQLLHMHATEPNLPLEDSPNAIAQQGAPTSPQEDALHHEGLADFAHRVAHQSGCVAVGWALVKLAEAAGAAIPQGMALPALLSRMDTPLPPHLFPALCIRHPAASRSEAHLQGAEELIRFLVEHISSRPFLNSVLKASQRDAGLMQHVYVVLFRQCLWVLEQRCEGSLPALASELLERLNSLMSIQAFASTLQSLLESDQQDQQIRGLRLLRDKVEEAGEEFGTAQVSQAFVELLGPVTGLARQRAAAPVVRQAAFQAIQRLCTALASAAPAKGSSHPLMKCVEAAEDVAGRQPPGPVGAAALLALGAAYRSMGPALVSRVPRTLPNLVRAVQSGLAAAYAQKSAKDDESAQLYCACSLQCAAAVVHAVPSVLSPYVADLVGALVHASPSAQAQSSPAAPALAGLQQALIMRIAPRLLLPACYRTLPSCAEDKFDALRRLLQVVAGVLALPPDHALPLDAPALAPGLFKFFLQVFRVLARPGEHNDAEEASVQAVMAMVMRLNESSFKPFFVKVHQWACGKSAEDCDPSAVRRRAVLYRLVAALARKLEFIFTGYFELVADDCISCLLLSPPDQLANSPRSQGTLRFCSMLRRIASTLHQFLLHDEEGQIGGERLEDITGPLTDQLECTLGGRKLYQQRMSKAVVPCLVQLAIRMDDVHMWRSLNHHILLATRNEDPLVRYHALRAIDELYKVLGERFLIHLPETASFLLELMEDSDSRVERLVHRVLSRIDTCLGPDRSIQEYLS